VLPVLLPVQLVLLLVLPVLHVMLYELHVLLPMMLLELPMLLPPCSSPKPLQPSPSLPQFTFSAQLVMYPVM
jgi:hypothetical protein